MRVKVSKETARLLQDGSLVSTLTGEYHKSIVYASGIRLRFVSGNYVRIAKSVSKSPDSWLALTLLADYPNGVVPKGLGRTVRWRCEKLRKVGYAVKLEDGSTLIDPNKFSCKGFPVDKLPNVFR